MREFIEGELGRLKSQMTPQELQAVKNITVTVTLCDDSPSEVWGFEKSGDIGAFTQALQNIP
jgi:hypothetical protein